MKKLFLLLVVIFLLSGCSDTNNNDTISPSPVNNSSETQNNAPPTDDNIPSDNPSINPKQQMIDDFCSMFPPVTLKANPAVVDLLEIKIFSGSTISDQFFNQILLTDNNNDLLLYLNRDMMSYTRYQFDRVLNNNIINMFTTTKRYGVYLPDTVFILDSNNVLFGIGSNNNGQLGDGTGINRTDEFVYVTDNVIDIVSYNSASGMSRVACVYAIKTDDSLWFWGNNEHYEPYQVKENVANVYPSRHDTLNLYLTTDGSLRFIHNDELLLNNVKQFYIDDDYAFVIMSDDSLWREKRSFNTATPFIDLTVLEKILDGVSALYLYESSYFAVLNNGDCWAWGDNKQPIGDGTKVPRDLPVYITDNVKNIHINNKYVTLFEKINNELYIAESDNPELIFIELPYQINNVVYLMHTNYSGCPMIYKDTDGNFVYYHYKARDIQTELHVIHSNS